ncbi:WecB/TagA/CpsF family glycosyltransferase [Treponema denticola]|uniref:WecB/TagA/CpsF family glycosyl transferase n=2 Tax=Treponema denticola TaxID=158 RepID=M2BXY1_TREDN|nr:WecB/TagA/CpsF family glycosyltransferase [Treponema denticola]EGC76840.1 WecB/TagA/CpsF family Glycosyl transferase [Treponema denticola F0402]EMB24582.1 WecB/TagA/CpsF family glycosyl transferase [Treponema denticola OTK]EMB29882.1 WecB/TagA/CpsF family glycosyl transferase [Treponema denticola H1-T]EMB30409.1 WecB/TagA/CpsF family glycosyl transferase [Treponema denticola MYR-T]EMB42931.1 WecB/TagA/CpsF family glycosyl transferase [Treponema denticola AL-2]
MAVKRINFLNVPLDVLHEEDMEETVMSLLNKEGPQQIIFMTIWDVLRARRNGEFRNMVKEAALCLPVSKSLIRGARFLKKDVPVRRQQFSVVIDFLNVIDSHYKSLYLFGGRQESLLVAEKNVRSTFPGLRLVGRFAGYYHKSMEPHIISAISKAAPSVVIIGKGVPGGRKWIYRNKEHFNSGIFIRYANLIDIFSKFKKRPSEKLFNSGWDFIIPVLKNPFRIFTFFGYIWYNILLLFYRLFRKG